MQRGSMGLNAGIAATIVVIGAAIGVRSLKGEVPLAPADRPRAVDALREPMQLLGRGASLRIAELDLRVEAARREEWIGVRRALFELQDCPSTKDWIDSVDGQRFERLVGELRRGARDEGLAALALVLELARKTEWNTGPLAGTASAERLGAFLQDWLRTWAERGVDDATLADPTVAAVLVYGRVMRRACRPLPIGRNDATYERARTFLAGLLFDAQGQPLALARALRTRHPTAIERFESKNDVLNDLDEASRQLFGDLDGECP